LHERGDRNISHTHFKTDNVQEERLQHVARPLT